MTSSLAAEVSLHCIICFEEFESKDRPPVVLPCGHTYVCLVCAKRLRKCMECREPLYWTPSQHSHKPAPVLGNPAMNTRSPATARYAVPRGRYSPGSQNPGGPVGGGPPVVKEEPIPLPLPKNTVLMGMMEAAERQAKLLEESRLKRALASRSIVTEEDEESLEGDNSGGREADAKGSSFDPLLAGLDALVGTCGTYAVREPLGLAVLPFDPNKRHHQDEVVASASSSSSSSQHAKEISEEKKTEEQHQQINPAKEPFTIEEGQMVQIVGVDEGVYQLARGEGYIVASFNQLVKVGGPLEKSCQYEGMLWSVQQKREELQRDLDEINGLVDGLKDKIIVEQGKDPEHPVITPPKLIEESHVNDENDVATSSSSHQGPTTPTGQGPVNPESPVGIRLTGGSTSSTEVNLGMQQMVTPGQRTPSPGETYAHSPAHSCPMPGTFSNHDLLQPSIDSEPAGLPRYRVTDDDVHGLPWSFGCGSGLFGERLIEQDCDAGGIMAYSFDDTLVDSAGAAGRSLAARTIAANANLTPGDATLRSGSFDGPINFRTGMSGHTGLNVSRKKSSPMSRPHIRMMSEHRGIAAGPTGNGPHPIPMSSNNHNLQHPQQQQPIRRPTGTLAPNHTE